jgi:hypothetical protein
MVVGIRGGLTGGDPTYAKAGELRFERTQGALVGLQGTSRAGEQFVVIGGLLE